MINYQTHLNPPWSFCAKIPLAQYLSGSVFPLLLEAHPVPLPVASDFKVLIGIWKNGLSTFFIFFVFLIIARRITAFYAARYLLSYSKRANTSCF
jgi:hypothetical protein